MGCKIKSVGSNARVGSSPTSATKNARVGEW